jgi:hypothetical protein
MIWILLTRMRMQNMRLSLKSSIHPQTDLSMNFSWFTFACVCITNVQQVSLYGPPYGRRRHTVHTVDHTATLKTVWATPGCGPCPPAAAPGCRPGVCRPDCRGAAVPGAGPPGRPCGGREKVLFSAIMTFDLPGQDDQIRVPGQSTQ